MKGAKSFNDKLNDDKGLPRYVTLTEEEAIKRLGGVNMLIAPPIYYSNIMKTIPYGKLTTSSKIREKLAKLNDADCTCNLTAGIFIALSANASEEREEDKIPYWRTLKSKGQLNDKFPHGVLDVKQKLEAEGHTIIQKGRKNIKYFVENFEDKLFDL